jgi:hypothetical protein
MATWVPAHHSTGTLRAREFAAVKCSGAASPARKGRIVQNGLNDLDKLANPGKLFPGHHRDVAMTVFTPQSEAGQT